MASFDENDFDSLYFHGLNLEDSRSILLEEEEGVFLIRDSSRGGYVICVKEDGEVMQYTVYEKQIEDETNFYVREEFPFKSFPALLSFYKMNMFKSTSLKRPVAHERVVLRRREGGNDRGFIRSEIPTGHSSNFVNSLRRSAPPDMSKPYDASSPFNSSIDPRYVRVIKAREPGAYTKDLPLKLNDLIRVTGKSSKPGMATGELNGQTGDFPLVNVEFVNTPKK